MKTTKLCMALLAGAAMLAGPAGAAELSIVSGATGQDIQDLRTQLDAYEKHSGNTVKIVEMPSSTTDQFGQYRLWLSAGNEDIDVYRTDVVWAPQLASHFVDLTDVAKDIADQNIPSIIESQTVDGKLIALPMFTDAPALYYRTDLLEKYGMEPPTTWAELETDAKEILEKEGNSNLNGFVFQGAPYEGLTCNGLEWVASFGGGQIVSPDGEITINNEKAAAALNAAKGWIGTIAPEGVLSYKEEEARGVWQTGNAVFMRNWPYAYALGQGGDSAVKDKFDVVKLPAGEGGDSAACLGGWNLAVSKYSQHQDEAIDLVKYLASAEAQKERALSTSKLPTIESVYEDSEVAEAQPIVAQWKDVVAGAVPRPSAPTKKQYNEVSKDFWTAVNETLAGRGTAEDNLKTLEGQLRRLKRSAWE
ncbi:ABC transporter substrate-binding protein [Consotaella aegiceratis]|uniref:ABC transporter substrate-binding protein n=1 Tax=Consotaella aegiceratis TaxID=3097961 RepID=UPI002F4222E6